MNIAIEQGVVKANGVEVGTAKHHLKYGYHPVIKVKIKKYTEEFEIDQPDLIKHIKSRVKDILSFMPQKEMK